MDNVENLSVKWPDEDRRISWGIINSDKFTHKLRFKQLENFFTQ